VAAAQNARIWSIAETEYDARRLAGRERQALRFGYRVGGQQAGAGGVGEGLGCARAGQGDRDLAHELREIVGEPVEVLFDRGGENDDVGAAFQGGAGEFRDGGASAAWAPGSSSRFRLWASSRDGPTRSPPSSDPLGPSGGGPGWSSLRAARAASAADSPAARYACMRRIRRSSASE
jgi:hypothetical protein